MLVGDSLAWYNSLLFIPLVCACFKVIFVARIIEELQPELFYLMVAECGEDWLPL